MKRVAISSVVSLCCGIACPAGAQYSAAITESTDLDANTAAILKAETELLEVNTGLYRESVARDPWGTRRWFLYQVTNTSLTSVGAFISGAGRFSYLHRGRIGRAPRDLFEHAAWYRVGANTETSLGVMLEIALDQLSQMRLRHQGLDLDTMRRHETSVLAQLDRMLAQRQELISKATLSPSALAYKTQETVSLKHIRDMAALEFDHYYSQAKVRRARIAVQYAFSLAGNAVSGACAFAGSVYPLQQRRATPRWRTRMGGVSGVGDVIGGSCNALGPFAMAVAEKIVKHRHPGGDDSERARLQTLLADDKQKPANVVPGEAAGFAVKKINVLSEILSAQENMSSANRRSEARRNIDRYVTGGITGGAKITNGIGGLIGAFHDTFNPHERFEVTGGTNLIYGTGYSIATVQMLRNQLLWEARRARAQREHRLPRQILDDQMAALQTLER